jgi:hypothetical protein
MFEGSFRTAPASRHRAIATLASALAMALVAPAGADWLVTKDGARIETKGPWRVDGKRVLFDLPNGTLSMIRVDQIDLDGSAVATAEARAPKSTSSAMAAPPKKEPVLVLTERDIPPSPAAAAAAAAAGEGEAEKAEEGAPASESSSLEVISWEKTETPDGSGIEIFGTIRNNSRNMVTSPSVLAAVYDADGRLLATNNGSVNAPNIPPGKIANFRVSFSGLLDFAAVKFDAQGRGFKVKTEGGEAEEGEEAVPEEALPPST